MKRFFVLAFLFVITTSAVCIIENVPPLKTINENPAHGYSRSYQVLESNNDTLFGEFSETYQGVLITHGYYRNNKPQGKWEFFNMDKTPNKVMSFDDGKPDGVFMRYSKTGDTLEYAFYKQGKPEGVSKMFFYSGPLNGIRTFKNGKRDGLSAFWYENGNPESSYIYADGKRNGEYKLYFDTGKLSEEGIYKNGKREGIVKQYYPSGKLLTEIEYRNDVEWNLISQNKSNGKPYKKSGTLKDGNGTLFLIRYNGKVQWQENIVNGNYDGPLLEFDEKGKIKHSTEYHGGAQNGKKIYYDNGIKIREENYSNDTLDGDFRLLNANGSIYLEGQYKMGKRVPGTWKRHTANGIEQQEDPDNDLKKKIKSDDRYFPDWGDDDFSTATLTYAEEMPEFAAGNFLEYLSANIKYPPAERDRGRQGTVYIGFTINKLGFIEDVSVVKGASDGLDAEALRCMKNMPRWNPGYSYGNPVTIRMTQPVRFVLK